MNVGRLKSSSRSSNERVCSGTIPKIAMRIAPPAMRMVPMTIHGEKTSPSRSRAKKAFQSKDTAPSGARMTTGSDAICTNEPKILDEMKTANPSSHKLCEMSYKGLDRSLRKKRTVSDAQHIEGGLAGPGLQHGSSAVWSSPRIARRKLGGL